jgi:hypothetical protein
MARPGYEKRKMLSEALSPLFRLLHQQGRRENWLAEQLCISPQKLSCFKNGVNFMPQALYDQACEILGAPWDICSRRLPIPRPGHYDRQKTYQKGA